MLTNLASLTEYTAYFKNLAVNHADILHDDTTNVRFGYFDYLGKKISSKVKGLCLMLDYPESDMRGNNEGTLEDLHCGFAIFKQPASDSRADIETAIEECKVIVRQILARMAHDYRAGTLEQFRLETVKLYKAGPWKNAWYGYRAEFTVSTPARVFIDNSKWNDIT